MTSKILKKCNVAICYAGNPEYSGRVACLKHEQLSFLMCFHQKSSQQGFCSLNAILTSKIRCASNNKFHNSNAFF